MKYSYYCPKRQKELVAETKDSPLGGCLFVLSGENVKESFYLTRRETLVLGALIQDWKGREENS